jgi:hypothetical protein
MGKAEWIGLIVAMAIFFGLGTIFGLQICQVEIVNHWTQCK